MCTSLRSARLQVKVPQITIYFWVIKLLTTAMGEATSDFMVYHMNRVLAVGLGALGLATALLIQFSVKRYVAWIYWLVVVMVSVFGTMAADATHIVLGVPYVWSTSVFFLVLMAVLWTWYRSEKTLSIHSIVTRRRECFYWLTVLSTFALGTAAGDMTATSLHLGYLTSGVLFSILLMLPFLGYRFMRLSATFTFWFAYIMTRPVGASFADLFGMAKSLGGLGVGKGHVSLFLSVWIVLLVAYLSVSKRDVPGDALNEREVATHTAR